MNLIVDLIKLLPSLIFQLLLMPPIIVNCFVSPFFEVLTITSLIRDGLLLFNALLSQSFLRLRLLLEEGISLGLQLLIS